ncbi:unnamed protein product, partial [Vitis vinifera]
MKIIKCTFNFDFLVSNTMTYQSKRIQLCSRYCSFT